MLGSRDTFIVFSLRGHPSLHDHQLCHVPLLDSNLKPVPSDESNSEVNGGEKLRNCQDYFSCFATVSPRHLKILHSIIVLYYVENFINGRRSQIKIERTVVSNYSL